jgi:molybdopterin molybdotransferase
MSGDSRTFLHPDEAIALVAESCPRSGSELERLDLCLGRVLAEDLLALVDQPPFDKSAMDGFAYGVPGPDGLWRIASVLRAGASAGPALRAGECARIMTGAPLPAGARAVQRVEWTEERAGPGGESLVAFLKEESGDNIIRRGENQKAGDPLLSRRALGPQDIGILASSGYGEVPVARRPRVGVLSTGDELAPQPLGRGGGLPTAAIYDSNGPQLLAQARDCGCEGVSLGIVRDDPGTIAASLAEALSRCDVLLLSGGVSMGDFDHVPRALAAAGVGRVFHGLAMKPGKPVFFGRSGDKSVFGLPGNPVSTFVAFELLVKPHLYARMGLAYAPRVLGARLAEAVTRREADRTEFLPCRLERGADGLPAARPLRYGGSSMLSVLAEADCLVRIDVGLASLEKGRIVDARLLRP